MKKFIPNLIIAFLLMPITLWGQLTLAFMSAEGSGTEFLGLIVFLLIVFVLALCLHVVFGVVAKLFGQEESRPTPTFKQYALTALTTTGIWLLLSSPFIILPFV